MGGGVKKTRGGIWVGDVRGKGPRGKNIKQRTKGHQVEKKKKKSIPAKFCQRHCQGEGGAGRGGETISGRLVFFGGFWKKMATNGGRAQGTNISEVAAPSIPGGGLIFVKINMMRNKNKQKGRGKENRCGKTEAGIG